MVYLLYIKRYVFCENKILNSKINVFIPRIGNLIIPGEKINIKIKLMRLYFLLLSRGKAKVYYIFNKEKNDMVHTSYLIPQCWKFSFLSKNDFEIGPCFTAPQYRGRGIYTNVLNYISSQEENNMANFYMIVNSKNIASIKGIENAGFKKIGIIKKCKYLKFYYGYRRLM